MVVDGSKLLWLIELAGKVNDVVDIGWKLMAHQATANVDSVIELIKCRFTLEDADGVPHEP